MPPRSILKNAPSDAAYRHADDELPSTEEVPFDRKKVIENTKLNSMHYAPDADAELTEGDKIRAELRNKRKLSLQQDPTQDLDEEHLKWDEKNILLNEQEKSATMVIDEPKTPYEGGFNPNNEYYRDDDEDSLNDAGFSLGDAAVDGSESKMNSLAGGEIEETVPEEEPEEEEEEPEEGEEEEQELTPEEKHRLFEEKRKQHYHLKGVSLHKPVTVSDDEDDE